MSSQNEWDQPILSRTKSSPEPAGLAPEEPVPRAKSRWLKLVGLSVPSLLVGAGLGGVTTLHLTGSKLGWDGLRPSISGATATMPVEPPNEDAQANSSAVSQMGEAYGYFMRLAQSEAVTPSVEAAFKHYITVSNGVSAEQSGAMAQRVGAMGSRYSSGFDRRYLAPMALASLHLDECAAGVLAARLEGRDDPALGARLASVAAEACKPHGALASMAHRDIPAFLAQCDVRFLQAAQAAEAGRLDASAFDAAASDPDKVIENPCPDPTRYITATPAEQSQAKP